MAEFVWLLFAADASPDDVLWMPDGFPLGVFDSQDAALLFAERMIAGSARMAGPLAWTRAKVQAGVDLAVCDGRVVFLLCNKLLNPRPRWIRPERWDGFLRETSAVP